MFSFGIFSFFFHFRDSSPFVLSNGFGDTTVPTGASVFHKDSAHSTAKRLPAVSGSHTLQQTTASMDQNASKEPEPVPVPFFFAEVGPVKPKFPPCGRNCSNSGRNVHLFPTAQFAGTAIGIDRETNPVSAWFEQQICKNSLNFSTPPIKAAEKGSRGDVKLRVKGNMEQVALFRPLCFSFFGQPSFRERGAEKSIYILPKLLFIFQYYVQFSGLSM